MICDVHCIPYTIQCTICLITCRGVIVIVDTEEGTHCAGGGCGGGGEYGSDGVD